jgi:hypothetical protein
VKNPIVNKWLDLLDRVLGTALASAAGATITVLSTGVDWEEGLLFVGVTVLGTVCKVLVGQNTGTDDTGALIGPVIEPAPQDEPKELVR